MKPAHLLLPLLFTALPALSQGTRLSLADALIALNERQKEWSIHFIHNDLGGYAVDTSGCATLPVPDAMRRLVGIYPVRISQEGRHLFVESLLQQQPGELPPELEGVPLMPEVVVTARRPLVQVADGRFIYEAATLMEEHPAASAHELLQRVPGIECADGRQLTIAGNDATTLIINGLRPLLSTEALMDYLLSLPAGQVERIEVTPAAPAEWQAQGTAVNIVLNRFGGKTRNGLLSTDLKWQGALSHDFRASFLADGERWSTSGQFAVNLQHTREQWLTEGIHPNTTERIREETHERDTTRDLRLYLSTAHRLGQHSTLEISDACNYAVSREGTTSRNNHYSDFQGRDSGHHFENDLQVAYISPRLNLGIAGYAAHDSRTQDIRFTFNMMNEDTLSVFHHSQSAIRLHGWADWNQPVAAHLALRTGGSYAWTSIHNRPETVIKTLETSTVGNNDYLLPPRPTARHLSEHTADLYVGLHGNHAHFCYDAVLRYEYYILSRQASPTLLPSLSLTWEPHPGHAFTASHTAVRHYPTYWSRQNYITYTSNYVQHRGNPDLRPALTHRFQLGYTLLGRYQWLFSYQRTSHPLMNQAVQAVNDWKLICQDQNLDLAERWMAVATVPLRRQGLSAQLNAYGWHERFVASGWHGYAYDHRAWSYAASATATVNLLRRPHLDLSALALYRSRTIEGAYSRTSASTLNLRLQWQSASGHLFAALCANDLLQRLTPEQHLRLAGQQSDVCGNYNRRTLQLTLTYRFNSNYKERTPRSMDNSRMGVK